MKENEDIGNLGGVQCPVCGCTKRKVIASLRARNCTTRRCICAGCSARFTTHEKLKNQDLVSPDLLLEALARLKHMEKSVSTLRTSLENAMINYN